MARNKRWIAVYYTGEGALQGGFKTRAVAAVDYEEAERMAEAVLAEAHGDGVAEIVWLAETDSPEEALAAYWEAQHDAMG